MLTKLCNTSRLLPPTSFLRGSCHHVRWRKKLLPPQYLFSTSVSSLPSVSPESNPPAKPSTQEESSSVSQTLPCQSSSDSPLLRLNSINIQMLSKRLHKQIFNFKKRKEMNLSTARQLEERKLFEKSREHLEIHRLWDKEGSILPDVDFDLPRLYGDSIDEHFQILANKQSKAYLELAQDLADSILPAMPKEWTFKEGWTKYAPGEEPTPVSFPDDRGIVFDVESCVTEGDFPTLAVAASTSAWYSWCSPRLIEEHLSLSQRVTLPDLIAIETKRNSTKPPTGRKWTPRLVVGHNVSFDRSFVKEQYFLQGTKTRFLDTLSLHMCVSGQTTLQRALWNVNAKGGKGVAAPWLRKQQKRKSFGPPATAWLLESSPNNLADVYQLYNQDGRSLDKSSRDVFVTGSMNDIRADFQALMTYCANDVAATHEVFTKLLPLFFERFPHPVTFAAMLEMGQAYLPINQNWERYLREAQETYDNLQQEMKQSLMDIANDACNLLHQDRFSEDPWLWELDWSTVDYKLKKQSPPKRLRRKKVETETEEEETGKDDDRKENEEAEDSGLVSDVLDTAKRIPKINQHMMGYPAWFREMCPKGKHADWSPGPSLISPQTRVTPKLLRLTWDSYPLHYTADHGWGYLVPGKNDKGRRGRFTQEEKSPPVFPLRSLEEMVASRKEELARSVNGSEEEREFIELAMDQDSNNGDNGINSTKGKTRQNSAPTHSGRLPVREVKIPGCWFYKLPHKDGADFNVGSPLAKDFLSKVEDGTLRSDGGAHADRILEINKFISFWRNANKRI